MSYPVSHRGIRSKPACPHAYVDASNVCLDCDEFIAGHGRQEQLCIYCSTEPVSDEHYPYCSNLCAVIASVA